MLFLNLDSKDFKGLPTKGDLAGVVLEIEPNSSTILLPPRVTDLRLTLGRLNC